MTGKKEWKWAAFGTVMLFGMLVGTPAFGAETGTLAGNGVQVQFDQHTGMVSLYRSQEDGTLLQMSQPSQISYPVVNGAVVSDFTDFTCTVEEDTEGTAGKGGRMTIVSHSAGTGLKRVCQVETVDEVEGLLYVTTGYQAEGGQVEIQKFLDCKFALYQPEQVVWSYNGGGEGAQSYYDTLQKIDLRDSQTFHRENKQDDTSVGIPAADIYSANGGIAVGDASTVRRALSTPVDEVNGTVETAIQRPARAIGAKETVQAGEGFVHIHKGDYYVGLRGYAEGMKRLGFETLSAEEIPESSYDLRWESWGWEFDWTLDLILGKLDELQALGIKQVTLDDGWYHNAGEWNLNRSKLPNGAADMKRLTDAIHARGMTALLWWRPCDGGREASRLYQEHPEYFVQNQDGTTGKLAGPGKYNQYNGTTGYALCPLSEGAVQSQVDFVKTAVGEWGFDGLKSDYVWSMPKCYNPAHHHARPEESTENQAVFYRETFAAMKACNPEAFHLLCNCGTPQDYYSLPYVTQIPTADPTSVDQTRRRVKAYKALCGDYFPVTTDHNEIWYPSAVGTGAVLIEKRVLTGNQQAEYEKWLAIAQREELQKGQFIGDLYSYGFDPYETYVVKKDGVMYYAFYKDGNKYKPQGNPQITLKGLDPDKLYRIVDYVNDQVIATNVPGSLASCSVSFGSYLLVKAEELSAWDVTAEETEVEETDGSLVYEGNWTAEQNSMFSGGSCKYTTAANASVSYTFRGNAVAWYGQNDTNFGSALVYIDDVLQAEVNCRGTAAAGVKLYEKTGLEEGMHTIRIVCKTPVIDIDHLTYTQSAAGNSSSVQSMAAFAAGYTADGFEKGSGWEAFQAAKAHLDALLASGTAAADVLADAETKLLEAVLAMRKEVKKELLDAAPLLPAETQAEGRYVGTLYQVMEYAKRLDVSNVIPVVRARFADALAKAQTVFRDPASSQNEIDRAWAELADAIQYTAYTMGDKTALQALLAECGNLDLSLYQDTAAFADARLAAEQKMADENALENEVTEAVRRLKEAKDGLKPIRQENGDKKDWKAEPVKVTSKLKVLQVSWSTREGAASYQIFIKKGGKWQAAGKTAGNTLAIKKLKAGTKYQVKLAACNAGGSELESQIVYTATKPAKPKVKRVQNYKKTGLKIQMKKLRCSGYEAWVKTGKKPYQKAASGKKAIVLKKGIRTGKKVSVKVRAYVTQKGTKIYGAFRKVNTHGGKK